MAGTFPINVDGVDYPSKTAAIMALADLGTLSHAEIGKKVGSGGGSVGAIISQQRRKAAKAAGEPSAMPGQWTPEKRDKVRRLFGTTMIYIAEAVQVPPAELLKYVLHGVIPPSQKIVRPDDIDWQPDQAQLPPPSPAAEPAMLPREAFEVPDTDPDVVDAEQFIVGSGPGQPQVVEPSRDDDEAELAAYDALQAEGRNIVRGETDHPKVQEVAPPAPARFPAADPRKVAQPVETIAPTRSPATGLFPAGRMVRLVREDGKFLHESLQGFTDKPEFAWEGTRVQFDTVKAQMPKLVSKLQFEVVP